MRQKTHSELNRLIGCTAISGLLLLNVQCRQPQNTNITIYSSSRDGDRLTKKADEAFIPDKESSLPIIKINAGKRFQKMDGFGATFNEAGLITLNTLAPEKKDSVLRRLFDPASGAGYTLMKSPIAACDFASAGPWYTYDDTPGDTAMEHFSVERDLGPNGLITFIKQANKYGKFEIESPMDFAPDWMYFGLKKGEKHAHIALATEDGIVHGGHLLEAFVEPTLEVMVTVEPVPLYKKSDPQFGINVIDPGQ